MRLTLRAYALLRLLCRLWPPSPPTEAAMPPARPIVARWLALPPGPFGSRILGGRARPDGSVAPRYILFDHLAIYEADAADEHRDDGETDLSGIPGLYWNLVAS